MSDELTDIDGVGDAMAGRLADAGFESIDDITAGTTDALADVEGIGDARAESVMQSAFQALEATDDSDSGSDTDSASETTAETTTDSTAEPQGFEVGFACSPTLYPHILGAVADEIRDAAQSNNRSRRAHAHAVFEALLGAEPDGEITITLQMDELVALQRSVKHRARRYRQSGTLPDLGSTMANRSERLQEIRNDHWGE